MSEKGTSILGGKSVYCINEAQLQEAVRLFESTDPEGDQLRAAVDDVERRLSRNERAALAFVLIERLRQVQA